MANYNKQFNFRNGVQVDNDNFIVSPTGLVGIGTTIPTESLDVRGDAKVVGLASVNRLYTPDLTATSASITNLTLGESVIGGGVSISSGIITASGAGVVTYYGDGGRLLNLPTSQWLDIDVGLGFTSIYAQGYVGVNTTDPRFPFQVSGNNVATVAGFTGGLGISTEGDVLTTGIVTASKFVGVGSDLTGLNASSIAYGTISNDRIPVLLNSKMPADISVSGVVTATGGFVGGVTGNVTGNLTGDVTGTASTALSLNGTPNIVVGLVTASDISVQDITSVNINSSGILTAPTINASTVNVTGNVGSANLNVTGIVTSSEFNVGTGGTIVNITTDGRIAIGSDAPTRNLEIISTTVSEIELVGSESRILLAQEKSGVGIADSSGVIRYGNSENSFELLNYTPGNFGFYLHAGGAGINTGRFDWIYGQNNFELMSLTYDGTLGLGITNPSNTLHVVGTSTVTSDSSVGGNLNVVGNLTVDGSINGTVTLPSVFDGNVNSTSGVSTFSNVIVSSGSSLGIGTDTPITDIDAFNKILVVGAIGVGQSFANIDNRLPDIGSIYTDGQIICDGVGIGTTSLGSQSKTLMVYGNVELYPGIEEQGGPPAQTSYISGEKIDLTFDNESTIGIGTTSSDASIDFRLAGKGVGGGEASFMLPPQVSTTVGLNTAGKEGALVFNTTTKKFQGYDGTTWHDLH